MMQHQWGIKALPQSNHKLAITKKHSAGGKNTNKASLDRSLKLSGLVLDPSMTEANIDALTRH